jgi:hypothetical protein
MVTAGAKTIQETFHLSTHGGGELVYDDCNETFLGQRKASQR